VQNHPLGTLPPSPELRWHKTFIKNALWILEYFLGNENREGLHISLAMISHKKRLVSMHRGDNFSNYRLKSFIHAVPGKLLNGVFAHSIISDCGLLSLICLSWTMHKCNLEFSVFIRSIPIEFQAKKG
jgi:hypothetical protein